MRQNGHVAPTQSTKAAAMLGARPISASAYQARSGMAVTPDISGPSTPTYNHAPSIATLPPPISATQSTARPSISGPSYNIGSTVQSASPNSYGSSSYPLAAMNAVAPAVNYMQPLQPTSSSLASSSTYPSAVSAPQTSSSQLPPPIQWNSAPVRANASGMGQQPLQPSMQWSSPAQAATPAPPPSWGASSILQPTKKENPFGDWGDLDPMR